ANTTARATPAPRRAATRRATEVASGTHAPSCPRSVTRDRAAPPATRGLRLHAPPATWGLRLHAPPASRELTAHSLPTPGLYAPAPTGSTSHTVRGRACTPLPPS